MCILVAIDIKVKSYLLMIFYNVLEHQLYICLNITHGVMQAGVGVRN